MCKDKFVINPNQFAYGGVYNPAKTVEACNSACVADDTCTGYDYVDTNNCFLHFTDYWLAQGGGDINNYRREKVCS